MTGNPTDFLRRTNLSQDGSLHYKTEEQNDENYTNANQQPRPKPA